MRTALLICMCFCLVPPASGVDGSTQPSQTLSFAQALEAVLQNHPRLAADALAKPIAQASAVQAGLRPNPVLSVEFEGIRIGGRPETESTSRSFVLDADGTFSSSSTRTRSLQEGGPLAEAEITLRLSQIIELGGKRTARIEAAQLRESVAAWDYEVSRYRLAGETIVRFTDALVAQERVRLARQLLTLSKSTLRAVAGQVAAGEAAPLAEKRARAETEAFRIRVVDAEQAAQTARVRLAGLWGENQPAFNAVAGALSPLDALPKLPQIRAVRRTHPLVARWQAELAHRETVAVLEDARAVPDVTLSLGYRAERSAGSRSNAIESGFGGNSWSYERTDSGWSHALTVEASMPLPLWNRNQGRRTAARLEASRTVHEEQAALRELDSVLAAYHAEASAAKNQAEAIASGLLPELEEVRALTEEGYDRGKYGLLDLLDAERALAEAELEESEARIAYFRAAAKLESILGMPLDSVRGGTMDKEQTL